MARENTVILYGRVIQKPAIYVDSNTNQITSGQITLTTLRRSYATSELILKGAIRLDVPCVFSRNEKIIRNQMADIEQGDMVMVKGSLRTQESSRRYICPYCGNEHVKEGAVIVYIDPIHIKRLETGCDEKAGFELLRNNDEISNQIFIFGTLCREPSYYTNEESRKKECQFQIATNRKRRIEADGPDKRTDYPWVKTFGGLALECSEVLHVDSSIYINGAIETREITQKFVCEECGQNFEKKGYTTEIVPYSIEYLKNCNIPEKAEEDELDEEETAEQ